jgi:hypothetical protein
MVVASYGYNITVLDRYMIPKLGTISGDLYNLYSIEQCASRCTDLQCNAFSYAPNNTCYIANSDFIITRQAHHMTFIACPDFQRCVCSTEQYLHETRDTNGCYGCSCQNTKQDPCYDTNYRGTINVTTNNKSCQSWSAQTPHEHTRTPDRFPNADLINNYCRNPDGSAHQWCFTTDPNVQWDYCDTCATEEATTTVDSTSTEEATTVDSTSTEEATTVDSTSTEEATTVDSTSTEKATTVDSTSTEEATTTLKANTSIPTSEVDSEVSLENYSRSYLKSHILELSLITSGLLLAVIVCTVFYMRRRTCKVTQIQQIPPCGRGSLHKNPLYQSSTDI